MNDKEQIDKAVKILGEGGNVAIPTETVYGLAGKISSDLALRSIFQIKKRPFFDPLIVHVATIEEAKKLTLSWPTSAQILAEAFWPGPLTLVLPKSNKVSDLITSGLETVAIRIPNHPFTLEIINQLGEPIAAPSANKFGKTSPSEAIHVVNEFADQIFVVDGGPCTVGIESTIVKIEETKTSIEIKFLRYGAITEEDLQRVLGNQNKMVTYTQSDNKIEAPGQIKHHYMPSIPLLLIEKGNWEKEEKNLKFINQKFNSQFRQPSFLQLNTKPEQAARELYGSLRKASEKPHDLIIFIKEPYHSSGGYWTAILDRLQRAATFVV